MEWTATSDVQSFVTGAVTNLGALLELGMRWSMDCQPMMAERAGVYAYRGGADVADSELMA